MRQWFHHALAGRHRDAAIAQLRRLEAKLPSPASRFAVPFVFRGRGLFKSIEPRQNPVEIESLYRLVCELLPRRVLEIGTAKGGSLYLWTQAATPDAIVGSVDLPGGDYGGAYPLARVPFYQAFARPGQKLHLLRDDSHQPRTRQQAAAWFAGGPVDFMFIDGDHTYEGVKADLFDYGPLARPGGLIAFHDILPRDPAANIHVDRLWAELKARFDCRDLIGPEGSGRQIGIGVMRVPEGGFKPW